VSIHNRLAREYGGLFYHCCRRYDRHFESIARTDGFLGFDAQPSHNDFDKLEATLTKAHGIWTRVCGPNDMAYIRRLHGKVGMLFNVGGDTRAEAIAKAKDFLAELRAL
jgi:hypothetical protein